MKDLQKRIGENDKIIAKKVKTKAQAEKRLKEAKEKNNSRAWEIEYDNIKKCNNEIEELEKQNKVLEQSLAILLDIVNWKEVK